MPRVTLAMQPYVYVLVRGKRYRWESFDLPKIEITPDRDHPSAPASSRA